MINKLILLGIVLFTIVAVGIEACEPDPSVANLEIPAK